MGNFFEKNSCLEKKDSAADAEENRENARSCRQKVLYAAGLAGGLYAVLRYLLPLVAPFVFAFSLSEFYIRSFAGQRKGCGFAKTS